MLPVTVHTSLGDWSIFRREDAVNEYAPDRKHGPVPLARPRGTVPGERSQLPGARIGRFSCDKTLAVRCSDAWLPPNTAVENRRTKHSGINCLL